MSLGQQLAPQLPFLRRFARALAGSQTAGDQIVRATLEGIVSDPTAIRRDIDPRLALYRLFLEIWNSVDRSLAQDGSEERLEAITKKRLEGLSELSRRALLLTALEDFSSVDTAFLLDIQGSDEVDKLVQEALEHIESRIHSTVLIVEDEPIIAMDLEAIVRDLGHTVVGIARNSADAVRLANIKKPGLILMDIQLEDGFTGIQAAKKIIEHIKPPLIFITAYPEKLLIDSRPEPTFLITKPFQRSTVKAAISQALFFDGDFSLSPTTPADNPKNIPEEHHELSIESLQPLDAPIDAEIVGTQLKQVRRGKAQSFTSAPNIDALRKLHLKTAERICLSMAGSNLGLPFLSRMEEVRRCLSEDFNASSSLELGVQARGLVTMVNTINDQLSSNTASDIVIFVNDIVDLAWTFPSFRDFAKNSENTIRLSAEHKEALIQASKIIEEQSDENVDPYLKASLSAARINAEDGQDAITELGLRRSIGNVMRGYGRFIFERGRGINDNTWRTFDKTAGGTVGAILAAILILTPILYCLAVLMPDEFGFIVAIAKAAKLMIP
jgi:CheY-like chemotaxis protein